MIYIHRIAFNPLQVNCFVLYDDTKEAVIVDAGCFSEQEKKQLDHFIKNENLKPVKLLLTHGHFDHIMGAEYVTTTYGIPAVCHKEDEVLIENATSHANMFGVPFEPIDGADEHVNDGDIIKFGESELEVIHLPGHSPGGVGFYNKEQGFIILGDVLFQGSIGRTDLPLGNHEALINSIKSRLLVMEPTVKVFTGHGEPTTIGFERDHNPFLQ